MARRGRSPGPEVSLFPFLSILACLIGALTILIVGLSFSEILHGRKDEAVARAEDYVALEREHVVREEQVAHREEEQRLANEALAALAEIQPRLEKVKSDVTALERLLSERGPLREEVAKLRERRGEIGAERNTVEAGLAEGRKQLGELAKQLGKGLPLRILATSDYFRRVAPIFVEARDEGVVVHSPSQVVTVPRGEIGKDPKFRQVVDFVAAEDNRIIVFLVRADGRASYAAAEDFARVNGAVTSKVPLLGSGDVDLKEFFRKR